MLHFQVIKNKKCVKFNLYPQWYDEPASKELRDLLKTTRISDLPQRRLNKWKMEQLINPIRALNHRKKIIKRNSIANE